MRNVRAVGHVAWWVFVVSALFTYFAQNTAIGLPRRYADYLPEDGFDQGNTFAMLMLAAAIVVVIATIGEAMLGKRWEPGILTVGAPLLGGLLIVVVAMGGFGGYRFDLWVLFVLTLAGVAIREGWSRALAPTRLDD
ncbi:MAG: hypothetical protein QM728_00750 [Gordonia sp. (in: high G+C Gram-positive bacteria)]|uniref:hypothetical protein n=1 Tax=Gordonia sp. (in: high G+C Gram-positive bacteria) TaxID=84139 RepID=UPI0039E414F0